MRIALTEGVGAGLAQQCQHTDRPSGARAQRAAQHPIGKGFGRRRRDGVVHRQRPALRLRQREELAVRAHQELSVGGARATGTHERHVLLGHEQRAGEGMQVLDGLLQQLLQLTRAVGIRYGRLVGALGEQQTEVLVEATDGLVQLLDGGVRDEVASHALEHRREQRVGEAEIGDLAVLGVRLAAHDGEDGEQLLRLIAQRAQVDGQVAGEQPQLAGATRVRRGRQQCIVDDVHQVGAGHGVGGPHELARGPEHRHAGGARQERTHQAHVGVEAGTRLSGDVLGGGGLAHIR